MHFKVVCTIVWFNNGRHYISDEAGLESTRMFGNDRPGGFAYIVTKKSVRVGAGVQSSFYVH